MGKVKKLADALKDVGKSVKEGMTKAQIKKRAAKIEGEVSQLKAKLKDQAKSDASSKSSFKGKTPDKSSKSQSIETRKVNERNKRLEKEADLRFKKTKDLDDEYSSPLRFKDGSGKKGVDAKSRGVVDRKFRKPKKAAGRMLGKGIKAVPVKLSKNKSTVKPVPTKVPKIKAKPKKLAGGGMLGPHPQQGRPMNIAAPQGPRAKQPIRNMTIPYGKIAKKGPGMKGGGIVNKTKATGAAIKGFGKAYMKGNR